MVISDDGTVVGMDLEHIAAVNSQNAVNMVKRVCLRPGKFGKVENSRHVYAYRKVQMSDNISVIVFLDCTDEYITANNVMTLCMTIGLISYMAVFILVSIASKHVVQPTIDNIEMTGSMSVAKGVDTKALMQSAGITAAGLVLHQSFLGQAYAVGKGLVKPNENETRIRSAGENLYNSTPLTYLNKGEEFVLEEKGLVELKLKPLE